MSTREILIIHLSDMHLFVDEHGRTRPPDDVARVVKAAEYAARRIAPKLLNDLVSGLNRHSRRALHALWRTLDTIIANTSEGRTIVLAQTGDVEAYGGRRLDDGYDFPGYDYLAEEIANRTGKGKVAKHIGKSIKMSCHVYGNHDVWPSTFPLAARPKSCHRAALDLMNHPLFADPMPRAKRFDDNHIGFEFYSINTVTYNRRPNAWAQGNFLPNDPRSPGKFFRHKETTLLDELKIPRNRHERATIRFMLVHHPPHFFAATGHWKDCLAGPITDVDLLQQVLAKHRFHFILAGHRHLADPATGVTLRPRATGPGRPQHPLLRNTVQLVTGTPTQKGAEPAMFSVYRVQVDADEHGEGHVDLHRTIYTFDGRSRLFDSHPTERIVHGMSIK